MSDGEATNFYEWRAAAGPRMWADIMARVDAGIDPGKHTLAAAVSVFGVPPQSEASKYIARRLSGEARGRRGNPGYRRGPRATRPTDDQLRGEYLEALADARAMKKHTPKEFRTAGKGATPGQMALQRVADRHSIGLETTRKAVRRGKPKSE